MILLIYLKKDAQLDQTSQFSVAFVLSISASKTSGVFKGGVERVQRVERAEHPRPRTSVRLPGKLQDGS